MPDLTSPCLPARRTRTAAAAALALSLGLSMGLALAAAGAAQAAPLVPDTVTTAGDLAGAAPGYVDHATLTTAYVDPSDPALSDPGAVGSGAVGYNDLETLLGTALAADTYEGSALVWQFSAAAGSTLTLDWALSTLGYDAGFIDRAGWWLDGVLMGEESVDALGRSGQWQATLTGSGPHTLAVALLDVNDATGTSTLALRNLALAAPVPEPAGLALSALGLALGAGALRRRRPG